MTDRLTIITGDCLAGLKTLPEECVDLTVTSPPYDKLRTYDGHCEWNFEATALELFRVTKPGGVVCWNVGDSVVDGSETLTSFRQAIYFKDKCGFRVHDTMIYHKLNFSHPERVRYHQVFEYVFVLSKGTAKTFNPIKDKKNSTSGCLGNFGVNTFTEADGSKSEREKRVTSAFGMRGNVWTGKTSGQEVVCSKLEHPAKMPDWLARDLVRSWSNPGDTVLDPFAGSFTTGAVAIELGRSAIMLELNPEHAEMGKRRCDITPGLSM